jgi:hypothetical protein
MSSGEEMSAIKGWYEVFERLPAPVEESAKIRIETKLLYNYQNGKAFFAHSSPLHQGE